MTSYDKPDEVNAAVNTTTSPRLRTEASHTYNSMWSSDPGIPPAVMAKFSPDDVSRARNEPGLGASHHDSDVHNTCRLESMMRTGDPLSRGKCR